MTRDRLLADLSRAVAACFPDRAEAIMREVEARLSGRCPTCRQVGFLPYDRLCVPCTTQSMIQSFGVPTLYIATERSRGVAITNNTDADVHVSNSPRPPDNSEGR